MPAGRALLTAMMPGVIRNAVLAAAAAVLLGGAAPASQTTPQAGLKTLERFEDLQAAFRKDAGQLRLVLLLSPT